MPGIGHQLVEPGSLRLGAADLVGVFLDDLVTTLLGQLAQVVKLRLRVLIEGGDAEVEGRALHASGPSSPVSGQPACAYGHTPR